MFKEIKKYYDVGSDALSGAGTGAALGSIVPGLGTLAGGLIGGGIGLVSGLFQKKKANNILKQNPYPTQNIPQEVLRNQQEAEQMSLQGMPSQQYQQAQKDIQRQQQQALNAATDRRSGVDSISAIQEASNDATGRLNAMDSQQRIQNRLNLQTVNNQVAGWRDKLFNVNQRDKYLQNYQYGMSLLGAGNQNMMGGADRLLGGLVGAYANGTFNVLFGNKNSIPNRDGSVAGNSYRYMQPIEQGGVSGSPANNISSINPYGYSNNGLIQ